MLVPVKEKFEEVAAKIKDIVQKQGLIKDYVVSQGTSGSWYYRKWNSGKAECWGRITATKSHYTTSNSFYGYYGSVTYPFTFTENPRYVYNVQVGSGFAMSGTGTMGESKTGTNWYALSTVSGSQSCVVYMYVFGKWK